MADREHHGHGPSNERRVMWALLLTGGRASGRPATLIDIATWIVAEAIERLFAPMQVLAGP